MVEQVGGIRLGVLLMGVLAGLTSFTGVLTPGVTLWLLLTCIPAALMGTRSWAGSFGLAALVAVAWSFVAMPDKTWWPTHAWFYLVIIGVHALSFVLCNMVHLTNWVLHGLCERFPNLPVIWIESGLAWIPFLMQRLDDQFLMRQSEAPALKMLPSEYMARHCWYSSQPMERGNMKALEVTFEMMRAESQLLWSSDWPHFDFDTPRVIYDLPFLSEDAKRNILGRNAQRLFGLPDRKPPSS